MKTQSFKLMALLVITAIISLGNARAEVITVSGKVMDVSDGSPLIGVSVVEEGTTNGTTTNMEGNYSIRVEKGNTLVFSYIGYSIRKVKVTGKTLNVTLKLDEQVLAETVVVGYNRQAQKDKGVKFSPPKLVYESVSLNDRSESLSFFSSEEYDSAPENKFLFVKDRPLSTFSIDVDAASYGNMRRFINQGQLPPSDAIRTEELVNYFSYNYSKPNGKDPVKISTEIGSCPWNESHRLVKIALKAREIADKDLPSSNLVFLIDVSGSMYGPTRLELVKSSLKLLINNLREEDRVAIVVYAGSAGEVLPSTSGADKQKIRESLDQLTAGGSTAGGAGIQLAYKIANKNFIKGGNNRIILCTDGDFNVGVSSTQGLEELIEKERKSGVFLTVLGYGMGNYKDNRMQVLAEKGNGNHAYIDNLQEANKVLVNEFGGTLFTVAKDVKLQIEFNPVQVQAYRLIGYESRLLKDEDFNDDTKDAGEMGAGHNVTAFYEVVPAGIQFSGGGSVDPLKYQVVTKKEEKPANYTGSSELMTIKLRYKDPDGDTSKKLETAVTDSKLNHVSSDFRFAAAIAMFGQILSDSQFKGDATMDKVIALAKTGLDNDEQGYRREFVRLAEAARGMR